MIKCYHVYDFFFHVLWCMTLNFIHNLKIRSIINTTFILQTYVKKIKFELFKR